MRGKEEAGLPPPLVVRERQVFGENNRDFGFGTSMLFNRISPTSLNKVDSLGAKRGSFFKFAIFAFANEVNTFLWVVKHTLLYFCFSICGHKNRGNLGKIWERRHFGQGSFLELYPLLLQDQGTRLP